MLSWLKTRLGTSTSSEYVLGGVEWTLPRAIGTMNDGSRS